jgi:hypothetical protein
VRAIEEDGRKSEFVKEKETKMKWSSEKAKGFSRECEE